MSDKNIDKDIEIAEKFIKQIKTDNHYKDDNGWSGYYNTELKLLSQAIENVLAELEIKQKHLNFYEKHGSYKAKIEELSLELKTYKKIAETLVDFIMSCYESRMCLGIITGLEEKITFEDALDWARNEVLKDE